MARGRSNVRLARPDATLRVGDATLRFFVGDCLEVLRALQAHSVSAVVTSPPYNLGIRYRTYRDALPRQRYLDWTGEWVGAVARVLETRGSLFLNVGANPLTRGRLWTSRARRGLICICRTRFTGREA